MSEDKSSLKPWEVRIASGGREDLGGGVFHQPTKVVCRHCGYDDGISNGEPACCEAAIEMWERKNL
jgi:hypothetical protein